MWNTKRVKQAIVFGSVAASLALASVGTTSAAEVKDEENAKVRVKVELVSPAQNGVLTYNITATNIGDGFASDATINVPLASEGLRLVNASFDESTGWVSQADADLLKLQTGRLNSGGDSIKATVQLAQAATGAEIDQALAFTWRDADKGGKGLSNDPSAANKTYTLNLAATATGFAISGNTFQESESVFFWLNTPDGTVIPTRIRKGEVLDVRKLNLTEDGKDNGAESATANGLGIVEVTLNASKWTPGTYTLVARGDVSGRTAVTTIQIR
ncbi:MAG: hypothetical protein OHK0050_16700 [Roseiflexaceae bacterium]